eukprot:c45615_g1_i1 orf=139-327(+)
MAACSDLTRLLHFERPGCWRMGIAAMKSYFFYLFKLCIVYYCKRKKLKAYGFGVCSEANLLE